MAIGLNGGRLKPTSGFAFQRIQAGSAAIVGSLPAIFTALFAHNLVERVLAFLIDAEHPPRCRGGPSARNPARITFDTTWTGFLRPTLALPDTGPSRQADIHKKAG
jgi:hypothetical protein